MLSYQAAVTIYSSAHLAERRRYGTALLWDDMAALDLYHLCMPIWCPYDMHALGAHVQHRRFKSRCVGKTLQALPVCLQTRVAPSGSFTWVKLMRIPPTLWGPACGALGKFFGVRD
jgi:hypothetical protein